MVHKTDNWKEALLKVRQGLNETKEPIVELSADEVINEEIDALILLLDEDTTEEIVSEDDKRDGDPCWKGYKQVGMKKKGGKEVPNCVPMNEEELEKAGIKKEDVDYSHVEDLEEGKYAKLTEKNMLGRLAKSMSLNEDNKQKLFDYFESGELEQ